MWAWEQEGEPARRVRKSRLGRAKGPCVYWGLGVQWTCRRAYVCTCEAVAGPEASGQGVTK